MGSATQWWFQRFKDTARPDADQFLDLFWRVPPAQHGDVLSEIGTWAAGLRTERLVAQLHVSGYQPQPGRYGHGQALDAAHAVFAADSAAAVTQIRAALAAEVPMQALAAASMVDIAASLAAHPAQGLGWLCTVLPRRTGPTDAELRRTTEKFTSPGAPAPALLDLPGGDLITMAWQQRATALAAYRDHLGQQDRDPSTVLRSLLHGHHLRAVAADPVREEATDRLARSCALSLTSRRPR
ncbi:thiopeptide-type bacteriocin biosynthesis protein [Kitasatospora sp. NPDC051984]|uniref:thiopeptide-type bacteriocin biosynthesis protein n=1 Tax=Kitasatospora sp. NPDC051984 TaxID=3364059 RepID=UPI0037C9333B